MFWKDRRGGMSKKQSVAAKKRWEDSEERKKQSARQKKRYEDSEKYKKHCITMKIAHNTPVAIENHRNARKKFHQEHPEISKNQSASLKKYYQEHPEKCKKQSENQKKFHQNHPGFQKEINNRPKVKASNSASTKRLWQDPEWKERQLRAICKGWRVKPNNPEKKLQKLLDERGPKEYQLNVNAEIMILGGRIPDFVNVNGQKKIIEMFGDYWHGEERTGITNKQAEQERIDYFAQYGYQTLIIWERELEDIEQLQDKLEEFCVSV